ncbi:hypothetical protein QE152_g13968 [Popillia japonica]|uniref:Neuropeptide-like 4 n=1 Tax=Popillia japonica TaxID=7064 RepID=A0AAW1LAR9_POPJA
MFKYILFAALLAFAAATPDAEPKAKPALVAAYSAPLAAPYAYSAYSAYAGAPVVSPYAYPYAAQVVY